VSPSSAAAAQVIPPVQSPISAAAAPAPEPPASAAASPGNNPPQLALRANADAWLQVRDKSSGQILLNRILHAGETWPVPARPNLVMTTGNAGGTELVVDGTSTGVLGGSGVVRRDLPLDPELIKEGRLNPPPGNGIQPASVRTPSQ
jgi:cytoskeleton protein RodZ